MWEVFMLAGLLTLLGVWTLQCLLVKLYIGDLNIGEYWQDSVGHWKGICAKEDCSRGLNVSRTLLLSRLCKGVDIASECKLCQSRTLWPRKTLCIGSATCLVHIRLNGIFFWSCELCQGFEQSLGYEKVRGVKSVGGRSNGGSLKTSEVGVVV